jgi:hypothetical protein
VLQEWFKCDYLIKVEVMGAAISLCKREAFQYASNEGITDSIQYPSSLMVVNLPFLTTSVMRLRNSFAHCEMLLV